jgi:hypothetical protein
MATVNVYVPDEMKERLEEADLKLSEIARRCWEIELELARALGADEVRIEFETEEIRFRGKLLASNGEQALYLKEDGDLVWVDEYRDKWETSGRDGVEPDGLFNFFRDRDAYADAMRALGLKHVTYL